MTFKIFVDSDTLLDFLVDRIPFADYSQSLLNKGKQKSLMLCTSTLVLANIHYIISKTINKQAALSSIKYLIEIMEVLPFEGSHINSAITGEHADFEDSIQYYIAKQNTCKVVISRNIKHYKKFDIPVQTAEQFLRTQN